MRVLVDCTQISRRKAGVGVYAVNLLKELIMASPEINFFLLAQNDDCDFNFSKHSNVVTYKVPARWFRKLPLRFLLEQFGLPVLCFWWRVDVLHSLHYSFPLLPLRAKKVVTFHDMTMLLMPDVHLRSKVRYFGFFIRAAQKYVDCILSVSEATAADYRRLFPLSMTPTRVAPLGKSADFHSGLDQSKIEALRKRIGLDKPYILYVGTLEPRKNLARLTQAFQQFASRHAKFQLVLAGKMGWMSDDLPVIAQRLGLEGRVLFTGFVPEADKPYLIGGCDVFVYPSLYEGFGIPLLEAMACGVPTLSSNTSSLTEVAGDGALLIDPLSIDAIDAGLERLVSDSDFRADLQSKGIEQAAKFTWKRTAEETLAAYRLLSAAPEPGRKGGDDR